MFLQNTSIHKPIDQMDLVLVLANTLYDDDHVLIKETQSRTRCFMAAIPLDQNKLNLVHICLLLPFKLNLQSKSRV